MSGCNGRNILLNVLHQYFTFLLDFLLVEYSFVMAHITRHSVPLVHQNQRLPSIVFFTEVPFHPVLSDPRRTHGDGGARVGILVVPALLALLGLGGVATLVAGELVHVHREVVLDVLLNVDVPEALSGNVRPVGMALVVHVVVLVLVRVVVLLLVV